jgi:23S rRNA pseudouridine2457 synthase
MVSQFVRYESHRRNKKLLGLLHDFPEGTMSVGRLDEKSEGLLLLTTDGHVSYDVRSAKVEKEYYAQVDGEITPDAIGLLKEGVEIGFEGKKYRTLPCEASKIEDPLFPARSMKIRDARHGPTSWVSIILREGKNRQVRKMTAAVGFPTLRLVRVRIGTYSIPNLEPEYVEEIDEEVLALLMS